jgi:hypothetical protein
MLPIKMITLRMMASHYLASQGGGYAGPHRMVGSLSAFQKLNGQSIGIQLSRVALCGALEFGIDLSLWGLQYMAITRFGKAIFGWGAL